MNIQFEKANLSHVDMIFAWLTEPHMMEFWDNSEDHKNDILNFIHGRQQTYFYGTTIYWIGSINNEPFCLILSDILENDQNLTDIHRKHMSKSGKNITLDFGIGNKKYLGKGLAAPTLGEFIRFYQNYDPDAAVFFIDPDQKNTKAKHVYSKAGFEDAGEYDVQEGSFYGSVSRLMFKKC